MKILVIDDSLAMRKIIKWTIRQSNMRIEEIFEASSCQEAMLLIDTKNPDIIIADWNMPDMLGLEILSRLRKLNNFVKFGFFVNQTTTSILNLANKAGANFIISNPTAENTFETQINQPIKTQH